jgi:O-antigen/teichoic acid export membrane protein
MLGTTQIAIGETDKPVLVNIAHTATSVAASFALIPILGATGAAIANVSGSIVANPLNVMFLVRKNIDVDVMTYVKPIFLFAIHAVVYLVTMPQNLLMSSLFVVTFLAGSVLFSIITLDDINLIVGEVEKILRSFKFPLMRKSEL